MFDSIDNTLATMSITDASHPPCHYVPDIFSKNSD